MYFLFSCRHTDSQSIKTIIVQLKEISEFGLSFKYEEEDAKNVSNFFLLLLTESENGQPRALFFQDVI
jgi:hypothetical protein